MQEAEYAELVIQYKNIGSETICVTNIPLESYVPVPDLPDFKVELLSSDMGHIDESLNIISVYENRTATLNLKIHDMEDRYTTLYILYGGQKYTCSLSEKDVSGNKTAKFSFTVPSSQSDASEYEMTFYILDHRFGERELATYSMSPKIYVPQPEPPLMVGVQTELGGQYGGGSLTFPITSTSEQLTLYFTFRKVVTITSGCVRVYYSESIMDPGITEEIYGTVGQGFYSGDYYVVPITFDCFEPGMFKTISLSYGSSASLVFDYKLNGVDQGEMNIVFQFMEP